MSTEKAAKRRRAGDLGLLAPTPLSAVQPAVELAAGSSDGEEVAAKPDVFEFFAERASKQRELETEVQRLKQRETQLVARLEDAELQASRLRASSSGAAARQQAREAQLELQLQGQHDALRLEMQRSAELSQQLRAAAAALEAAEARAAAAAEEAPMAAEQQAAPDGAELRLQLTQLQRELDQVQADREEEARRAQEQLRTAGARYEAEAATTRMLQQQLNDAVAQAERSAAEKRAVESRLAATERRLVLAETAAEAAKSGGGGGDAVLIKSLRSQLREQEGLVAEARRLKEQATNVHVLREQLERADARARQAEELLPDAAELQGRLAEAEQQLQRWRVILEGAAECATPEDVLHLLNRLQRLQMEAAVQVGDKAEEVARLRSQAEAADAARLEAEAAALRAQQAAEEAAASLSRAERKLALLGKERDGLKSILSSYDEEYLSQHGSELGPQQARIIELEAQVQALHAHVRTLEEELGSRSTAAAGASCTASDAAARAEAAEARARALEAEAQNLGKQLALMQERLGRGEYNAATTRVLHFKFNPEAEMAREVRDARVAELESENEALKQHLQRLEAAATAAVQQQQQSQEGGQGEPGPTASPAGAALSGGSMRIAQLEGETNLLRRKVAELQKGMDRLQQVFNKQITLFREAVYSLFGFRVEMATDPTARDFKAQFALRPQHSDDASQQLVFRMLRDNRLVLVPTDFSGTLQREVETFIDRFRSIPAFTANLTMEYFQKQTQC
ncbi:hypothetical protein D9Q98_003206 [Chlorella vulgaris]|uniref:Mitotic spindle assembly checkpoint MAD1 n=1 Tax=Chlorella vulgaris TaxID=3077 RepID=A0A9D4TTI5_CHLVU|nr:hypothetical protein D9Q98_003206 [Chlorella vulgaris]